MKSTGLTVADRDFEDIGDDFRDLVTTQSYASGQAIDGVQFADLRLFSDEGGDFCELARITSEGGLAAMPDYRPAQMSYSLMLPGTIKAWHLHFRQDDVWFVPPGDRILVGLLDVRRDSPTYHQTMRFVLGAGRPRLLRVPRGVAHGLANLTDRPSSILYFTDRVFDADDPDERRLPFDIIGADFWSRRAE